MVMENAQEQNVEEGMGIEDTRKEHLKELWYKIMRRVRVFIEGSRESFLCCFKMEEI